MWPSQIVSLLLLDGQWRTGHPGHILPITVCLTRPWSAGLSHPLTLFTLQCCLVQYWFSMQSSFYLIRCKKISTCVLLYNMDLRCVGGCSYTETEQWSLPGQGLSPSSEAPSGLWLSSKNGINALSWLTLESPNNRTIKVDVSLSNKYISLSNSTFPAGTLSFPGCYLVEIRAPFY